jgi:tRNA/rRNA methyltransferase
MLAGIKLDNISIVLNRPRYPENIGAAARAMQNMGIGNLVVVAPRNCDLTRILKMATHAAADVVEEMRIAGTLADALGPFSFVVGTTARLGRHRPVIDSPARLARELIPISRCNNVAVLFGPEDRGLTNEDIRLCHRLVNIPTAAFASINLAQAVMIICYELFGAGRTEIAGYPPRLANRHELDGMYEQMKEILVRIHYINPENPDHWMDRIRHFFTRLQLQARDVSIIRGICRQINWYAAKCFEDGRSSREVRPCD